MPLRRGFGATGGEFAEDPARARTRTTARASRRRPTTSWWLTTSPHAALRRRQAHDPRRPVGGRHRVDGDRRHASRRPRRGALVRRGRGGNPDFRPGVPCAIEPVAKLLESVGKNVRVPVLLHYAENDLFFNAQTSRLWYERFTASGARPSTCCSRRSAATATTFSARCSACATGCRRSSSSSEGTASRSSASMPRCRSRRSSACRTCAATAAAASTAPSWNRPAARYAVSGDGRCGFAGGARRRRCRGARVPHEREGTVLALRGGRQHRLGARRQGHGLRRAVTKNRSAFPGPRPAAAPG